MNGFVRAFDMFCGAGGSSTGMARACAERGINVQLTAVNHWDVAIATHSVNHPTMAHHCVDVDHVRMDSLAPDGVDVLWGSPSCTEHSYAKGGKSIDDQKRASAWAVPRAVEAWRPKVVIVENVRNFLKWGPTELVLNRKTKQPKLDKKGRPIYRPIASRKGETFRAWFAAIESFGYEGKWELLNAADYGEAQMRLRLFVVFTAIGYRYQYPQPTHAKSGMLEVQSGLRKPWEAARKIIDFDLPSTSIFDRKEPLSPNTLRRIEAGILRYCSGAVAEAFLVVLRQYADAQSLDLPVPTVVGSGTHLALAEPHIRPFVGGNRMNNVPVDVEQPAPTVTSATGGGLYLAEPEAFILNQGDVGTQPRALGDPIPTVRAGGGGSIVEPMLINVCHGDRPHQPRTVEEPLTTVTGKNGIGMAEPFLATYYGEQGNGARTNSVDEPVPTVTTANRFGVVDPSVAPFIVPQDTEANLRGMDEPIPTVRTTSRGVRLIQPYLVAHFGGEASRFGGYLVEIDGALYVIDIKFRMLQPEELALAQGFPDDYEFTGTKEARTAQIGNAVCVKVAYHLMREALNTIYGDALPAAA